MQHSIDKSFSEYHESLSITIRVLQKVLGKTLVMVLLCHSRDCGCFEVLCLFCVQGLLLYFVLQRDEMVRNT